MLSFQTGKVNAGSFQTSFLQYMYCKSVENQPYGDERFVCPACTPDMLAVSVDGNRKLYRFQQTNQLVCLYVIPINTITMIFLYLKWHWNEITVTLWPCFVCRSQEPGFFDGLFLAKDSEVSTFVEEVRGVVQSVSFKQVKDGSAKKSGL